MASCRLKLGVASVTIAALVAACAGARTPPPAQQLGYEVAYRAARGVRAGYELCAARALAQRDLPLARRCDAAYEAARGGLLAAEAVLDAWAEARGGELGCAAGRAATGMVTLGDALAGAGVSVPATLTEATRVTARLASLAAGMCAAAPEMVADGG